jgi:glycine/D-amino acid oxidase-like deaminating enzyme
MVHATGFQAAGGIRTRGNGQVDPYRACVGLARAALLEGAALFEHSPVQRIDIGRHDASVVTPRGSLRAEYVVIATGYATPFLKRLATRFRLMNTYVVATRRISDPERRAIGLGDVMLWDTSRPYYYARWTDDGRLLLGGADRPFAKGHRRERAFRPRVNLVRRHFEKLWPALAAIDDEFAWEGLFAATPDGLPYIGEHPDYPRHLFALGYGGNGMTFGFLAAQLLLGQKSGRPAADLALFAFDRPKSGSTTARPAGG